MFEEAQLLNFFHAHVVPWMMKIGVALTIFVIGQVIAKIVSGVISKLLAHTKLDKILIDFLSSVVRALLLVVIIVAALDKLGVNTNSLIAMLGAAGLAIGLALQSSL